MAYYAAVISLKHTIHRLLNSSQISILPSSRKIIECAYEKVNSLQKVLQKWESSSNNNSKTVDFLREHIRDAAYKLEDAVESHVSNQFLSRSERLGDEGNNLLTFSLDSDEVLKEEIRHFTDMVNGMEGVVCEQDVEILYRKPCLSRKKKDDADSSRIDFGGLESKMVGFSDGFSYIKDMLLNENFDRRVISISGMAGIGKTTLAKKIYQDPEIFNVFDCCLWVTIGPKYQLRKIMLDILAQLNVDINKIPTRTCDSLFADVRGHLVTKRYLMVVDDVWHETNWIELKNGLISSIPCSFLLTTRLRHISYAIDGNLQMRFLNEEESWCLLRQKVFCEESCPPQLEKAGKRIAKNCDGLPLLIVAVADLLSKAEKTLEYWTRIADGKDKSIFTEANDKISSILLKSYRYLCQDLKACFLYMGVFPSKCVIPASKLINLWIAEDLIEPNKFYKSFQLWAEQCIETLVSSNIVLEHQKTSMGLSIKPCSLHFSFWHACVKQSWKEKFAHVISSPADISKKGVKSWRRLCTYNNVLFGFKEVYNSVASISSAHSLICSGPYHQYPVPICFVLRLLKVLDILSVRFYKFPFEVLKLIHLRYLALTYNGKVPSSISKLWNLEYLIVCRHLNIKFPGDSSYLPVEIWNLQKLRHLQVMGSCLPYLFDAFLPELLKLSDISARSCTKEILERIPNLQKLGIQIEL